MRDRELYATILGVQAPWTVERVELDVAGGAVHVWLTRAEGAPAPCPECQTACPIYDHREREWRHLDTCQPQTRLHARVPRVDCPTHGVVRSEEHTSELQSRLHLVCRLLLEKKKNSLNT